jgi:hypothetical protein
VELIPDKYYFSTKDLSQDDNSQSSNPPTEPSKRVRFIPLQKWELRVMTWSTTDFFGPLSLVDLFTRKYSFTDFTDVGSVCFYVTPSIKLKHSKVNQFDVDAELAAHRDNEALANVVLFIASSLV